MFDRKWLVLGAIVGALLLAWIGYASKKEYDTLKQKCDRVGGTLMYDSIQERLYCKVNRPRPRPSTSWWPF